MDAQARLWECSRCEPQPIPGEEVGRGGRTSHCTPLGETGVDVIPPCLGGILPGWGGMFYVPGASLEANSRNITACSRY